MQDLYEKYVHNSKIMFAICFSCMYFLKMVPGFISVFLVFKFPVLENSRHSTAPCCRDMHKSNAPECLVTKRSPLKDFVPKTSLAPQNKQAKKTLARKLLIDS